MAVLLLQAALVTQSCLSFSSGDSLTGRFIESVLLDEAIPIE